MGRLHGRRGRMYVGLASAAAVASPVAFLNKWDADFSTDDTEMTAFEDSNKVYVAGLPDSTGSFGGWYDDATPQLYTAAQDGEARKFYLYPSTANTAQYWFGTAIFDFKVDSGVAQGVAVSGNWKAASTVAKVG